MRRFPDLTIYLRAIVLLVRHPSVLAGPLLGAAVALVLSELGAYLLAPLGGAGAGIFDFIADVFYGFAFGIAVIQADMIVRGIPGGFDAAWEETRRKAGGIILASVGFWFVSNIAEYVGSMFDIYVLLALLLITYFFFIYTIPAAAIGGLPGTLALGGSIRAVRADYIGAAFLAIAFVALFVFLPPILARYLAVRFALSHTVAVLVLEGINALALTYLAFPFAKQYADVAYRV